MKSREAWYVGKAPEKQNRLWSDSEKMKVFTMRENNHSAAEIAKKFNTSIIKIYNVTRLVRKGLKDECYICGHDLTEEEIRRNKYRLVKACDGCKKKSGDYKKDLRTKAAERGLCVYCAKQVGTAIFGKKALPGHKACKHCISATHRRRYAQNLCGTCGKNPIGKGRIALCDECAATSKTKTAIYRQRIKHEHHHHQAG